ncbi:ADP-glyceromanno-heptose 6-epimerase [Elusimicrobiota bacterium]
MIAVTGACGFIGSALIWGLNNRGICDVLAVDVSSSIDDKKKANLSSLKYRELIDNESFLTDLGKNRYGEMECIMHMGACSSTTETDWEYLKKTNFEYTQALAETACRDNIRFIYASSAATYGDGSAGFSDDHIDLNILKPLNSYGRTKHMLDLWAYENGLLEKIVGLKYFNVYGPNEYHKQDMRSFINKAFKQISETQQVRLFKSYRNEYAHGHQVRDFIYIKDVVDMTLHFFDKKDLNGIFNIGTGIPRTWNDLVKAVFLAMGLAPYIEYIDMPESIKGQYQYYTCADMDKFMRTGFNLVPLTLEKGVQDYVHKYLLQDKYLESINRSNL